MFYIVEKYTLSESSVEFLKCTYPKIHTSISCGFSNYNLKFSVIYEVHLFMLIFLSIICTFFGENVKMYHCNDTMKAHL